MSAIAAPAAPAGPRPDRRRARRPHPDPAPAARPLRRPAAAPPLALLLHASSCCAPTTGAATTCSANAPRRAGACSSARASTTPSPPTTATCSTAARRLTLDQLHDAYRDHWTRELAAEQAQRGINWDAELDEQRRLHHRPATRSRSPCAELIPVLGRPVAVQRELDYALAPGLEWTIQGFLDLETLRPSDDGSELVPAIVDYKVKNTLHSQAKADHDPQAGLYLAGRWLAGDPAEHFCFAQIGKPGTRRKTMSDRVRRHPPHASASCARRSRGSRRPPARSTRSTSASGPTSRGASPTRAAGSARRATARTTPAARAAADCERPGRTNGRLPAPRARR